MQDRDRCSGQSPRTIRDWLAVSANTYGKNIAISSVDERPSLTYQGLFQQTQTIANQISAIGLKPGDIIAIALENGSDFLTSTLSIASVATAFLLNPDQPEVEFERYFSQLDIKAVIVRHNSHSSIVSLANLKNIPIIELSSDSITAAGQFTLTTIEPITTTNQIVSPRLDDYAILVGTSGSTGQPKIISLTHESFFVSINHAANWMHLTECDRSLVITPFAFLHALVRSSCPLLTRGGEVVCTPGYNPVKILDWLERYQPSFFTGVPSMYRSLLQCIKNAGGISGQKSLRFLVTGSDKIEAREIKQVEAALGVPLIQFYGMSEVSPLPAIKPLPPEFSKAGAVGKVNPVWKIACVDEEGNHLPIGEEGEIILKGGYINRLISKNNSAVQNIRNGWFYTGDLGYLDGNDFLYYTGRVDNRINRGGKKVYAGEIEAVLLANPEIKQSAVFGIPDQLYGECIGAVVVLHRDSSLTPKLIRQFVAQRAAEFKVPDYILIEDVLPLNQFGKVKRKTLAAHFGLDNIFAQKKETTLKARTSYTAPRTEIERSLAQIWQNLFKLDALSIDDNFFELGGHSLLGMELYAAIEEQFARKLPLNTLFDAPTIKELAVFLEQKEISEPWDSLVLLKPGKNKTPLFMVHDVNGDIILYLDLANRLDPERPVYGLRPYGKEGFSILHTRMTEMVNHYIERIRSVQPEGPYLLGGLCDGGVFAYEVGQKLQSQGHQVGMIALLEAVDHQAPRILYVPSLQTVQYRIRLMLYRFLLDRGFPIPKFLRNRVSVAMMMRLMKEGYEPETFQGKLALFVATEDAPRSLRAFRLSPHEPLFGWDKRATEGVEVYSVPGSHLGILKEPGVDILAKRIETCIEDAVREKASTVT